MTNETKCKEWILSEDYRDFIINENRTPFLENIAQNPVCEQYAGFDYRCIYLPALQAGTLTSKQFSYNSIPNVTLRLAWTHSIRLEFFPSKIIPPCN